MNDKEIMQGFADLMRECYLRDMGYLYVAEKYNISPEMVKHAYKELDKTHKEKYTGC